MCSRRHGRNVSGIRSTQDWKETERLSQVVEVEVEVGGVAGVVLVGGGDGWVMSWSSWEVRRWARKLVNLDRR